MRHVISVSISKETLEELREKLRHNPIFRNKSHFIEYAVKRLLKDG